MDPLNAFNQSPLKGTFFLHFAFITCANAICSWMPEIFLFYNLLFFICIFWSLISKTNPEPVQLSAIINLMAILFDIMIMTINYNHNHFRDGFGFSFFLLTCNILLRPFTSYILLRVYSDRDFRQTIYGDDFAGVGTGSGIANPNHENFIRPSTMPSTSHRGYQDLDQPQQSPQAQSKTVIDTIHDRDLKGPTTVQLPYQSVPEPIPRLIDSK